MAGEMAGSRGAARASGASCRSHVDCGAGASQSSCVPRPRPLCVETRSLREPQAAVTRSRLGASVSLPPRAVDPLRPPRPSRVPTREGSPQWSTGSTPAMEMNEAVRRDRPGPCDRLR